MCVCVCVCVCVRTEVALKVITGEDAVGLQRRAPHQQDGVFLGVGGGQDGHLCRNYGENDSYVNTFLHRYDSLAVCCLFVGGLNITSKCQSVLQKYFFSRVQII